MMSRPEAIGIMREAARTEAARLVRLAAMPREIDDTIAVCISRAAARLGWSYRRTEDVWRREARRIESFEMDALRKIARNHRPAVRR